MFFVYVIVCTCLTGPIGGWEALIAFAGFMIAHMLIAPETPTGRVGQWILKALCLFMFASAVFGIFSGKDE